MSVTAKCKNYTGCLLAYRGEEIKLAPGAPLICPECGKPVTANAGSGARFVRLAIIILVACLLAAAAGYAVFGLKNKTGSGAPTPAPKLAATPSPTPRSSGPAPDLNATPAKPKPKATPPKAAPTPVAKPAPPVADEPSAAAPVQPKVVDKVDTSNSDENHRVREEVLKRIDQMPKVSDANKDKLYNSVQRARGMGMVLQIPFASSRSTLSGPDVENLRQALQDPRVMQLRDDPTAVFVVLGYADAKGDDAKNLAYSQERANAVVNAMRDKCGVANVTHAVAMGKSTLHDAQNLEKNRVVEVWAVLP